MFRFAHRQLSLREVQRKLSLSRSKSLLRPSRRVLQAEQVDLNLLLEAVRPLLPTTVDLCGAFEVQVPGSGEYAYTTKSLIAWSAAEVSPRPGAGRWPSGRRLLCDTLGVACSHG